MRRFVVGAGIGLVALGASLAGSASPGLAQAGGEHPAPSSRRLAEDITSRLDRVPAPDATARALGAAQAGPPEQPASRERLHRAVQRAGEEVRRGR